MTRKTYIFLITSLLTISAFGQNITSIFRQLPAECTPQLTVAERDTLLKKGEYTIPGGDTIETTMYSIDTSEAKNYLRYEFNFTTGQAGFITFELKLFHTKDNKHYIVFSRCGGMKRAYDQQDIKIYELKKNTLSEISKQNLLPVTIAIDNFLKKEAPDISKTKFKQAISSCYSLKPEEPNEIEFNISPQTSIDTYEKWVLGYTIILTWNGNSFDQKLIIEK